MRTKIELNGRCLSEHFYMLPPADYVVFGGIEYEVAFTLINVDENTFYIILKDNE